MDDWRSDLGPLTLAATPGVRDVCVDGAGAVWTDTGSGFVRSVLTLSPSEVRHIGVSLVERGGGRVDDAMPIGDAALAGRARVHVVLPPVARQGPLLSIRLPNEHAISLSEFAYARDTHRDACVLGSVLISGVTGSGKTTLASALIAARPANSRIVIVEDIAELDPPHPHCVHLTSRHPNPDGGGAIGLGHLVKEALRMRPDSLVVGEIRGAEFSEFLLALTAGHHGISTVHARRLSDVAERMTVLGLTAGFPLPAIAPLA
ncbi:MAG: hypothetical protein RLZZ40_186, partial [Actinomycetota bacterium]